jgi:hypothetical protein
VRITRYVDAIAYKRTDVEAIVVLSQDFDLSPAIEYALSMSVPIFTAAQDVVQHRPYPYLLLGPQAYAEMTGQSSAGNGHGLRELLVRVLYDQRPIRWKVRNAGNRLILRHSSGLTAVPAPGVAVGTHGTAETLYPVDVTWDERIVGSFPVLVCTRSHPRAKCWDEAVVRRRTALMTVELRQDSGPAFRRHFPVGGVVPGDTVLVHRITGRVIGRLPNGSARLFDPDRPQIVRVGAILPKGGAIAIDEAGQRGLLATEQPVRRGQRIAAVQIDVKPRGPAWIPVGTPLP